MQLELSKGGQELREQFLALKTPENLADLLEIEYITLIFYLYRVRPTNNYSSFRIPKKSGGFRTISAPHTPLKIIQRKLNTILQDVYKPNPAVHGFTKGRSIVTNAVAQRRQKYVLNIDLENFFPSINFGRVRGMFIAVPYNLPEKVATVLAQICCFSNALPQGAPTSPIISNMICAKLDGQLLKLAKGYRCIYTRYADDITFSTSMRKFPHALASLNDSTDNPLEIGSDLNRIIKQNGFQINLNKVRLQPTSSRQEVTGLTVNRFPNVTRRYISQIRAMLHAWDKYELEAAQKEFIDKYSTKVNILITSMFPSRLLFEGK
jgi:RNA-directed DNA polymerase